MIDRSEYHAAVHATVHKHCIFTKHSPGCLQVRQIFGRPIDLGGAEADGSQEALVVLTFGGTFGAKVVSPAQQIWLRKAVHDACAENFC